MNTPENVVRYLSMSFGQRVMDLEVQLALARAEVAEWKQRAEQAEAKLTEKGEQAA